MPDIKLRFWIAWPVWPLIKLSITDNIIILPFLLSTFTERWISFVLATHFVEPEIDSGSLIMQAALSISDQDNIDSLTKKIHLLEHEILPLSISQAGYMLRNGFKGND